jgi:hypothetical protein
MLTFLRSNLILIVWAEKLSRIGRSQRKVVVVLLLFTIFVEEERCST